MLRKGLCLFKNGQSSRSTICPGVSLKQHFCPSQELGSVWLRRSRRKHWVCRAQEVMLSPQGCTAIPLSTVQPWCTSGLVQQKLHILQPNLSLNTWTRTCRRAVYLLQEPSTKMSVACRYPSPMGHQQGCTNEAIFTARQPAFERKGSFQAWSQMEE